MKVQIILVFCVALTWGALAQSGCSLLDGIALTYLSDPNNCSCFYECSNGRAFHFQCPKGLYFDDVKHVCAFLEDANCGSRSSINKEPTSADLFAVAGCPEIDGPEPTYLADPNNCGIFYECSNGKAIKQNCPPGTYFHNEQYVCVAAAYANCGNRSTTVAPTTTPSLQPATDDNYYYDDDTDNY